MKTLQFISAAVLMSGFTQAQTLQEAITKMDNERYEAAAANYRSLISREPNKGENYFYYGENFFRQDDLDSANMQFQKGTEVNATNPLNYVGLGKVLLYKGKDADAKAMFYKAATLGANKNTEVMRRTAEAYINTEKNKNPDEAINQISNAIKLDPKNEENYIIYGDALLEKNPADGGPAIKQYQKASELNPKSAKGLLRQGKLYQRGRNYQLALDFYKKAIELDPTFAPAYREIAEVYMMAGQPAKAIEYWKKYLELNNSSYARYRYMNALFNNKQYNEAITEGENLIKGGFTNFTIYRLLGWAYGETGSKTDTSAYSKGLRAINQFFELTKSTPNFKYLPGDYKYKGVLLSKTGKDSLGVVELMKAISIDTVANCELWVNVAQIWMKAKNYPKAIAAFNHKASCPKGLNINDYFELGRSYYYAGGAKLKEADAVKDAKQKAAKREEAKPLFVQADSSFAKMARLKADYPYSYYWRGRVDTYLDPENATWMAKPYYEKGLEVTKPEEKSSPSLKSLVIEACEYLGYYYVKQNDNAKATEYFNTIKELDPNNQKAKDFFNPPKGNPQKK